MGASVTNIIFEGDDNLRESGLPISKVTRHRFMDVLRKIWFLRAQLISNRRALTFPSTAIFKWCSTVDWIHFRRPLLHRRYDSPSLANFTASFVSAH
jgi:hypothetical protein